MQGPLTSADNRGGDAKLSRPAAAVTAISGTDKEDEEEELAPRPGREQEEEDVVAGGDTIAMLTTRDSPFSEDSWLDPVEPVLCGRRGGKRSRREAATAFAVATATSSSSSSSSSIIASSLSCDEIMCNSMAFLLLKVVLQRVHLYTRHPKCWTWCSLSTWL
jgi:hypothetical protein